MNKYTHLINQLQAGSIGQSDSESINDRVLIVDGLNTFIRSYAASPVMNSDGIHVGGISGTLLSIGHAIKFINPTRVIVVFDGKNGSQKRRQLYPEYKSNRKVKIRLNRSEEVEKQDNQLEQLLRLLQYFEILPFTVITLDSTEADDVVAYIAHDYLKEQVFIMSSDKDFLQLVDDRVHIWSPTKKKLYYTADVFEQYGVYPCNFPLYRAVTGDASDNIKGIDGIGDKTLLKKFPLISQDTQVSIDGLIDFAASSGKGKVFETVTKSKELLELNYSLMQLTESNISMQNKMKIIDFMQNKPDKTAKLRFYAMITEDKMGAAIKNVTMWLSEITQKLDRFVG
jgi:DNA polymerase-1